MKPRYLFKIVNQLALIVLLASSLLAACAPQSTPSATAQQTGPTTAAEPTQASTEPVKLIIWTAYGKQLQGAVDTYNAKMKAEGKNVEVTGTELAFESIADKFAVAVTTGDVPDILDLDLVLAPSFTSKGALLDITDWVNQAGLKDDFNPKFLDLGVWDDKIYMLPFSADVSVLYYNKDIFQKAGLDPEKKIETWDEFRDALLAIKKANLKNDAGQPVYAFAAASSAGSRMFCDMPFVWTDGGDWLNSKGEVILDSPATISGMKWLTSLYTTDQLAPPNPASMTWDDKMNLFYAGQVGSMCSGSYVIAEVKEKAPDLNYGLFLFPHPTGKGSPSSFIGGDLIGIPTASKHPKEAWDFIQYALSEAVQVEVWAKDGLPPVRESMAKNKYFDENPKYYTFTDGVKMGQCPKTTFYNELYDPWKTAWDEVFAGQKPVEQILKEAADSMREIVSR